MQVVRSNDAAFKSVQSTFEDLMAELLPSTPMSLVLTGAHAHLGVKLQLQQGHAGAEVGGSNLKQLSGGQRSVISLALILAVRIVLYSTHTYHSRVHSLATEGVAVCLSFEVGTVVRLAGTSYLQNSGVPTNIPPLLLGNAWLFFNWCISGQF